MTSLARRGSRAFGTLAAACLIAQAIGCGGRPAVELEAPRLEQAGGVALMVVQRPTQGRARLALWIDAGSADADPPQVATLAAWSVAESAAGGIEALVLPDGTELSVECSSEEVDATLGRLASAVAHRPTEIGPALARLLEARTRAGADARRADALARRALLGRSVDPLGDPETDERATLEAVRAFSGAHYGRGRLMLVAVGDVEREALRSRVEQAFLRVPEASPSQRAPLPANDAVHVEVGARSVTSLATRAQGVEAGAALAHRIVARAGGELGHVSSDVFPLRGGAAVIVRSTADPAQAARALAEAATMLRDDAHGGGGGWSGGDPSRWLALEWAGGRDRVVGGLGLGAVIAGGRGDAGGPADSELANRARSALDQELRAATSQIAFEGALDERGADVRLANGARIVARALPGAGSVAVVSRFEGGARDEGPGTHGATSLAVELARQSCQRTLARELGSVPDQLGIHVAARIEPSGWSLVVTGPAAHWPEVVHAALRCATPALDDPAGWELARTTLLAGVQAGAGWRASLAARTLSPARPGRIAPRGSAEGLAALEAVAAVRVLRATTVGRRARVAIAGEVPVSEAVQRIARFAASWPAGEAASAAGAWGAPAQLVEPAPEEHVEVLVAWRAPSPREHALAARLFAELAGRAAVRESRGTLLESSGGWIDGSAWAWIALRIGEEDVTRVVALARRAAASAREESAGALPAALATWSRQIAWAGAEPLPRAVLMADGAGPPPALDDARAALSALATSEASVVIARPRPR
ncbi:MAG: insulinase family protein [Sandaracinaceae bacterium]|nr:insulinase family protein [Sandaracinaceae bacterium]